MATGFIDVEITGGFHKIEEENMNNGNSARQDYFI